MSSNVSNDVIAWIFIVQGVVSVTAIVAVCSISYVAITGRRMIGRKGEREHDGPRALTYDRSER